MILNLRKLVLESLALSLIPYHHIPELGIVGPCLLQLSLQQGNTIVGSGHDLSKSAEFRGDFFGIRLDQSTSLQEFVDGQR